MANLIKIRNLTRQPLRIGKTFLPVVTLPGSGAPRFVDLDNGDVRRDLARFFPRWTRVQEQQFEHGLANGLPIALAAIPGTLAVTNASASITTSVDTTAVVKAGSYIQLATSNPASSPYYFVVSVNSTTIVLSLAYAGATAAAANFNVINPTTYRESIPRARVTTDSAAALVTQVMTHVAVPVQNGDVVSNLSFMSGATAAGTPTNWWFALYTAAGVLIAQSADQLTAAWAADTMKTLALATPFQVTADSTLYAAIMVKATTVPSLVGALFPRAAVSTGVQAQVRLAGNSGAALVGTAPGTIATPAAQTQLPYCILS